MSAIKVLGPLLAAGEQMLTVEGRNGGSKAIPIAEAAGALVVSVADDDSKDRLLASVRHLEGKGSATDAIRAHHPAIPAKAVALVLTVINWATESVSDNGTIDAHEYLELLPLLAKEAASE